MYSRRSPYSTAKIWPWFTIFGFGFHADMVAAGISNLLEPVRGHNGLVVELGCGSGLLTRHLVEAGHRLIELMRRRRCWRWLTTCSQRRAVRPARSFLDDDIPGCAAMVADGHPFNYLPDEESIDGALPRAPRPCSQVGSLRCTSAILSGVQSAETPPTWAG